MMIYKATGKTPLLTAFLVELGIQILISERAYNTLHNQHLYALGDKTVRNCSPIEVITDCALFLNSAAMINKILGLSDNYNSDRAQKIREIMELDKRTLCSISSVSIRNSMEHMDERLDLLVSERPVEIVVWDLTKNQSQAKHILRKFNPEEFTMQCLGKDLSMGSLDIKKCYKEIQQIGMAIQTGRKNISSAP